MSKGDYVNHLMTASHAVMEMRFHPYVLEECPRYYEHKDTLLPFRTVRLQLGMVGETCSLNPEGDGGGGSQVQSQHRL